MNENGQVYIPNDIQCFWCNGRAKNKGANRLGSGMNCVAYFCENCGGIANYAVYDGKRIRGFEVTFDYGETEEVEEDDRGGMESAAHEASGEGADPGVPG